MVISGQENYRSLIELHHQLPLFFQPWWLDQTCKDWDVILVYEGGKLQALFPVPIEKKLFLTLSRMPTLTPYLGPYFLEKDLSIGDQEKIIQKILFQMPQLKYFQFNTFPEFQNSFIFDQHGFTRTTKLTHFVDLTQNEEVLFQQINNRRRSYIRKMEKVLTIEEVKQPDMAMFCNWHRAAFAQKNKRYPFTEDSLEKTIAIAEQNEASIFWLAKEDDEPIAMLWTPFDNEKMYHLLGAYNPNQKRNGAMDLLVWTAIQKAKEMGKRIYDFEGSMDPGIASFFRNLGGSPKSYFCFEKNESLLWKVKLRILG